MIKVLDPKGCQTRIYADRVTEWQCSKKPVVTRDGKLYCKIHDTEYIKAKKKVLFAFGWNIFYPIIQPVGRC